MNGIAPLKEIVLD